MPHASDSNEQQTAEGYILSSLSNDINVELHPKKLVLPSGNTVQLDGINEEDKVLCEIYARIGKLKGSQTDKLHQIF